MLPSPTITPTAELPPAQVIMVKAEDRAEGLRRGLAMFDQSDFQGKDVFIKPNYNTKDLAPGSTHNDILQTTVSWLKDGGSGRLTVGDRSYEGASIVFEALGLAPMADEMGFELLDLAMMEADQWEMVSFEGCTWSSGFPFARPIREADAIVSLACLKTHGYGGHFTMSLKNSIGMVAGVVPGENHDYMEQLHAANFMRRMIADVNMAYNPDLVVIDGIDAFVDGGPWDGTLAHPGVILLGTDRVAIDAVGVSILRYLGTTRAVRQWGVFDQEQIFRSVQLGLGVGSWDKIEIVTDSPEGEAFIQELAEFQY
jgi:uncharacterized protein (DUF362 family)